MRFSHRDGTVVHLSYCSNVHPAEDVTGIVAQIGDYTAGLRRGLGVETIGLGLWLPAAAAKAFNDSERDLEILRTALQDAGAEVVTLNGFPYGGFHDAEVKHAVYRPDWSERERLEYTLDCASVLARLLPDDVSTGSISTLPFAWPGNGSIEDCMKAFVSLATELEKIRDETGKLVRVAVEPEPGCVIENSLQAAEMLGDLVPEWIGVCLDTCHMAVQFEDIAASVAALRRAGVGVFKMQLSSAIRSIDASADRRRLESFVETRFLHQTRTKLDDGTILGTDDLPDALSGGLPATGAEWRVHHHQPIDLQGEATTQSILLEALQVLMGGDEALVPHLDVETYTWSVLPSDVRPRDAAGLVRAMIGEVEWARASLLNLGLEEL